MNKNQIKQFIKEQLYDGNVKFKVKSKKKNKEKVTTSEIPVSKPHRYVALNLPQFQTTKITLRDTLPMKLYVESIDENTALASLTFNSSVGSIGQIQSLSLSSLLSSFPNADIQLARYNDNFIYFRVCYVELAFDPNFALNQFNFTDNYVYWKNGPRQFSNQSDITNTKPLMRFKLQDKYSVILTCNRPGDPKVGASGQAGTPVTAWSMLGTHTLEDAAVGGGHFNFVMPQGAVLYAPVSSVTFTNIVAGVINVNIVVELANMK